MLICENEEIKSKNILSVIRVKRPSDMQHRVWKSLEILMTHLRQVSSGDLLEPTGRDRTVPKRGG